MLGKCWLDKEVDTRLEGKGTPLGAPQAVGASTSPVAPQALSQPAASSPPEKPSWLESPLRHPHYISLHSERFQDGGLTALQEPVPFGKI